MTWNDTLIKAIEFSIVVSVGGMFYGFVSEKIKLTWPKLVAGDAVAVVLILIGVNFNYIVLTIIGVILLCIFGLLIYGKFFSF